MARMRPLFIAALVLVSLVFAQTDEPPLHADSSTLVKLPGGAEHSWHISVPERQTAILEVAEKQGMAGILSILRADGTELVEADLGQRIPGAKRLFIPPGASQIRIQPEDHGPVQRIFELRIDASHVIAEQDRVRLQADQLVGEGERLRRTEERTNLEQALPIYEKSLVLWVRLSDSSRQADTLLHLGDVHYALGSPKDALDAYHQALDFWTAHDNRAGIASALCQIAAISFDTGKQKEAEEDTARCLKIELSLDDPRGMAADLLIEAELEAAHGQNDRARSEYQQALAEAKRAGDQDLEGNVLLNLGDFEAKLAAWKDAIETEGRALQIARQQGDRLLIARCLGNLASDYVDTGDLRKAVGYLGEALPLKKVLSDPNSYATSLYNLGNAHAKLDEYQQAHINFAEALAIFQRTKYARGQAYVLTALGHLALNTGDETKAESFFREAQAQWRIASDRQGEVFALNALGDVAARRRQFHTAIQLHQQALAISRTDRLPREEERTLGYLADDFEEGHDASASLDDASRELDMIRKVGDPEGEARALLQQGRAWRSLHEYDRAQEALNQALQLDKSLGAQTAAADTLYELAALDKDLGRLTEANSTIAKALDILDATGVGAGSAETRMLFAASHRKTYELAIDVAMRLHDTVRAFELSERARARTLVDLIRGARLDIRQGVDPALLERERNIQDALNEKQDRLTRLMAASSHNAGTLAQAEKEIDDLIERYENVEAEIRRTSPHYAALVEPHVISLSDVQSELPDSQTALVEFWLGDERSYAWFVTKNACQGFQLPERAKIEGLARRAYSALTARNVILNETPEQRQARINSSDREFARVSTELSNVLLGPMKELPDIRHLWVVSDGALEYLPIAALPAPGSAAPLVSRYVIANLPSASVLAEVRQEVSARPPARREVAVFADPVFQADDERVTKSRPEHHGQPGAVAAPDLSRGSEDVDLASLPRLWFSRREADAVVALASRESVREALDFDASRAEAESLEMADYRILHFATHAFLDSRHPELSGLVLSLVDRQGRPQDGFLRLNEIYNLKLNADLVVLSGCQTALGQEVRSEGLVGLTRGFIYAGAPQVLASLWDVRDRATAEFMTRFYQPLLRSHLAPESALRAAQLAMMKDPRWSQPYFWAAFTMQGAR